MAIVYLGVGSNIGDKLANIQKAISLLKEHDEIKILAKSDFIETTPVGGPDEQENYLNGALKIETDLMLIDLLSQLKIIERKLGRKSDVKDAPRTMDLDILFYDDVVAQTKSVSVPHPRMTGRLFVLQPLAQIAADVMHPKLNKTVSQLLDELTHEDRSQLQST